MNAQLPRRRRQWSPAYTPPKAEQHASWPPGGGEALLVQSTSEDYMFFLVGCELKS